MPLVHRFRVVVTPPVAPIAWDSNTESNAQLNSDEQYRRDAQGHFLCCEQFLAGMACSFIELAVIPIWLQQSPRSDNIIMLVLIVG
ncbi:hypothetical protein O9929_19640 [Vibrio lentus]|nr:hypothetical protein [Vibrio lentus]